MQRFGNVKIESFSASVNSNWNNGIVFGGALCSMISLMTSRSSDSHVQVSFLSDERNNGKMNQAVVSRLVKIRFMVRSHHC